MTLDQSAITLRARDWLKKMIVTIFKTIHIDFDNKPDLLADTKGSVIADNTCTCLTGYHLRLVREDLTYII